MKGAVIKRTYFRQTDWNWKKEILKMRFPMLSEADLVSPDEGNNTMFEDLARTLGLSPEELDIVILTC